MASRMLDPRDKDFNSSDAERSPPPANPFALAGARTVAALRERSTANRLESKTALKNLLPASGAPGTRRARSAWANIWHEFVTDNLGKSLDTVPTADWLARFIFTMPKHIRSSYTCADSTTPPVPSWSTLYRGFEHTLHAINCEHAGFTLTYGDKQKIKDVFCTLLQEGKISKELKHEPQWITARVMAHFVRALLQYTIQHGTGDWSLVVQKCLGMALQAALSCRSGDVARTAMYDNTECLLYRDIELKVTHNAEPSAAEAETPLLDRVTFHAKVTLKHTKGHKRDPSSNHTVILESVGDGVLNSGDPLKLLLVHAVRHSCIKDAVTLEDAVEHALARHDGTIHWNFPSYPVLCGFSRCRINLTRPANAAQLTKNLNEAALLAGVSKKVRTHDLRRGAASDATRLLPQRSMEEGRKALGHSHLTSRLGTTDRYIGHDTTSTLGARLALPPAGVFDIQHLDTTSTARPASAIPRKPKRARPGEINEFLARPKESALNQLKRPREAASMRLVKERSEAYAIRLLEEQHQRVPVATFTNAATESAGDDDDEETTSEVAQPARDNNVIDPALLALSGISNNGQDALASQEYAEDVLQDLILRNGGTATATGLQILEAPASEFLPWLSKINTYSFANGRSKNTTMLRGGSRDEPTPHIRWCTTEGCKYSTISSYDLERQRQS
ncbi:hypothetical protein LTR66_006324 [Elasticomyces elasticus]|nr:hypothetical protein LTR66_006324 [Elasticomyces elasticus]